MTRFDLYPENRLLAEIDAAIQRLDPTAPKLLRGGLRFHAELRVDGHEVPPEIAAMFQPQLTALDFDSKAWVEFQHTIELRNGQSEWVGVADGRYRLTIPTPGKTFSRRNPRDELKERLYALVEFDYSGLPAEVEIKGRSIDLPPVRARLMDEIKLLSPADGSPFDLSEGFFRWSPIPRAAKYSLEIMVVRVNELGATQRFGWGGFETAATSVCLGVAPDQRRLLDNLAHAFRPGDMGSWHVFAFDSTGRRIGTVVGGDRSFVVARGMEQRK